MNITEIETTLHTLRARHQNLDEEMLITLLTASGWEEKVIKEAVVVFRNLLPKVEKGDEQKQETVPKVVLDTVSEIPLSKQEEVNQKVLEPVASTTLLQKSESINSLDTSLKKEGVQIISTSIPDIQNNKKEEVVNKDHVVTQPTNIVYYNNIGQEEGVLPVFKDVEEVVQKKEEQKIIEPQSLIVQPLEKIQVKEIEPPENLPLKPFESTPHVWPFSKYKEVFHGDTMPVLPQEERALVNKIILPQEHQEHKDHFVKKIKIKRTGFDGEDEGLIFLTGTTLLIILLLLAYMYSNGRL